MRPTFLFAHGAGAPSTHPWMERWAARLAKLGDVVRFDYPYMLEGRRTPDRQPKLLEAHKAALSNVRGKGKQPVVLIGKSMGSRIGCHVALEEPVSAVICFGYPLQGMGSSDPRKRRDAVLKQLATPILFVQGTRDKLCPLDVLEETREAMTAPNELLIVESGDHSLQCTKGQLKAWGKTQDDVDEEILDAIRKFLTRHIQ